VPKTSLWLPLVQASLLPVIMGAEVQQWPRR
jgi:hypothetical protein